MGKELSFTGFYASLEQQKHFNRPIIFENIDFTNDLKIEKIHSKCSITFLSCNFSGNFESVFLSSSTRLIFDECSVQGWMRFSGNNSSCADCRINLQRTRITKDFTLEAAVGVELEIANQSSLGALHVVKGNLQFLRFTDSAVTGDSSLNGLNTKNGILLHNVEFSGPLDIKGITSTLQLNRVKTGSSLNMASCRLEELSMENMICYKVGFNSCAVTGTFLLASNVFEDEFLIQNVIETTFSKHFENFTIRDNEFKSSFYALGDEDNGLSFNSVDILFNDRLKGTIYFRYSQIQQLSLSGNNLSASVTFSNTSIKSLSIERLINRGLLNFISLTSGGKKGMLTIVHSVMGKTYLSDCYLNTYDQVSIQHSNLAELGTASTHWFEFENVNDGMEAPERASTNRDLFRQLKMVMEKQGDTQDRLNFRREEMRAFRAEPRGKKTVGDQIAMTLNLSNDDGQNWIKPVYILLFFTLLAYGSMSFVKFHFTPVDKRGAYITLFLNNIHSYFILLNPTHRVIDLDMAGPGLGEFWIYFIDFIHRIGLSYLLFQIITAFRKFHK